MRKHAKPWELYDIEADRTELNDLAPDHLDRVAELSAAHQVWADCCAVIPREDVLELYAQRGHGLPEE